MNDFDESFLGPCLIDVVRLCTSVFLASDLVKVEQADCRKLVRALLNSYASNLQAGHIKYIEQRTDKGFVKDLLDHAGKVSAQVAEKLALERYEEFDKSRRQEEKQIADDEDIVLLEALKEKAKQLEPQSGK